MPFLLHYCMKKTFSRRRHRRIHHRQNLRRLRSEKGYSVADLQTYLGMEYPQAVYHWQAGRNLPSVDHLYAISRLLQVAVDDILVEKAA